MTKQIQWNATRAEHKLIVQIAQRAVKLAAKYDVEYTQSDAIMDVEACHCNGNPLDLNKLLTADDFNFAHDVFGIAKHLDRSTGELVGCFSPRCSLP